MAKVGSQTVNSGIEDHPYSGLPERAFWRTAIGNRSFFDIKEVYQPKFPFTRNTKIAGFGSCFAQHFGRALKDRGLPYIDAEPAPEGLGTTNAVKFGYGAFSARTGNIYTTGSLLQWLSWAIGDSAVPDVWWQHNKHNRFIDPFRPTIEPEGFESLSELTESRNQTLRSIRAAVEMCSIFVFTLGLTERWLDVGGWEYPLCPGTAGGNFDPASHVFDNMSFGSIRRDLLEALRLLRTANGKVRILLTVSPVPLTATKQPGHVLVNASYSKSVLRAVAGELAHQHKAFDYFPSYELISSVASQGVFFEPNKRTVSQHGISFVMEKFFESVGLSDCFDADSERSSNSSNDDQCSVLCDDELLDKFGIEG